jgi:drug/metabolite transporter (DMT)-like permease
LGQVTAQKVAGVVVCLGGVCAIALGGSTNNAASGGDDDGGGGGGKQFAANAFVLLAAILYAVFEVCRACSMPAVYSGTPCPLFVLYAVSDYSRCGAAREPPPAALAALSSLHSDTQRPV